MGAWIQPVFTSQTIHAAKLCEISRYNNQSPASRVTSDEEIVTSDRFAETFEGRADVGCMVCGLLIEGQYLQSRDEPFDLASIVFWPSGLCGAMQKFGEDDRRNAKGIGL